MLYPWYIQCWSPGASVFGPSGASFSAAGASERAGAMSEGIKGGSGSFTSSCESGRSLMKLSCSYITYIVYDLVLSSISAAL